MTFSHTTLALVLLSSAAAAAAAPSYTLVDLGPDTSASAINSRGDVLGADAYDLYPQIWRDGIWHPLAEIYNRTNELHAINNADVAAGLENDNGYGPHAVMWTHGGRAIDLSAQLPESNSVATGVAADGTVVGWFREFDKSPRTFVVKSGVLTIVPCPDRASGCTAQGISPNGIVAGTLTLKSPRQQVAALRHHGEWWNIGTLGGSYASAIAVNKHGHAAGSSERTGDQELAAFYYADGTMVDLGLTSTESVATAINADDTVVGYAWDDIASVRRGFVWQAGESWRLDEVVVDLPPGWSLLGATGVNDMGWIVGTADVEGEYAHGYLLKPVSR